MPKQERVVDAEDRLRARTRGGPAIDAYQFNGAIDRGLPSGREVLGKMVGKALENLVGGKAKDKLVEALGSDPALCRAVRDYGKRSQGQQQGVEAPAL